MVKIKKKCNQSEQKRFDRCEKKVMKTVVPRSKKQTKRGAAIAICRVSVGCK